MPQRNDAPRSVEVLASARPPALHHLQAPRDLGRTRFAGGALRTYAGAAGHIAPQPLDQLARYRHLEAPAATAALLDGAFIVIAAHGATVRWRRHSLLTRVQVDWRKMLGAAPIRAASLGSR